MPGMLMQSLPADGWENFVVSCVLRSDGAESSIQHVSCTVDAATGGLKGITAFKRETLLHNSLKCVWLGSSLSSSTEWLSD